MKKKFLFVTLVGLISIALVVVSCKKDESDYDKGKEDGVAFCNCIEKAAETEDAVAAAKCLNIIDVSKVVDTEDESKWTDYQKGFAEGAEKCMDAMDE
jgi:hypothetical protein